MVYTIGNDKFFISFNNINIIKYSKYLESCFELTNSSIFYIPNRFKFRDVDLYIRCYNDITILNIEKINSNFLNLVHYLQDDNLLPNLANILYKSRSIEKYNGVIYNFLFDIFLYFPLIYIPVYMDDDEYFYNTWLKKNLKIVESNNESTNSKVISYYYNIFSNEMIPQCCNLFSREYYYKTGELQLIYHYYNCKLDGVCKSFYKSGNLSSMRTYKDNKVNGVVLSYYDTPDKQIMSKIFYRNDIKYNTKETWYRNGNKKLYRTYLNNFKHGIERQWYENGKLKSKKNYDSGFEHGRQEYYINNELYYIDIMNYGILIDRFIL